MGRQTPDIEDDSEEPRPRVPRDAIITEHETEDTATDDEPDPVSDKPLFDNPTKLERQLSEGALSSVSLIGSIHADTVVDVSPTSITVGTTYEPQPEDGHIDSVYSLANSDACVESTGSQKIGWRYVPRQLKFEKTFRFDTEVDSVTALRDELQAIFGSGISLTRESPTDDVETESADITDYR